MFDSEMTFTQRLTDAVDLLIDFATLGEYGLEPARKPLLECEARRHSVSPYSAGSWAAAVDRFATHS